MKQDKQLVAFIKFKDQPPFIDLVEISKKSVSYFYDGEWWQRIHPPFSSSCENRAGNKLTINPLSRTCNPYEDIMLQVVVKERAKQRYESWLAGRLKKGQENDQTKPEKIEMKRL